MIFEEYQQAEGDRKLALQEELVRALRKHGHAVCWQVLRKHSPDVVNWAVFLALERAPGFRGEAQFSTWFHTIVRNLCLNVLRQDRQRAEVSIDGVDPELLAKKIRVDPRLEHQRNDITPKEWELVELKADGLRDVEIAEVLGVSPAAIWQRWYRLRKRLGQQGQERV